MFIRINIFSNLMRTINDLEKTVGRFVVDWVHNHLLGTMDYDTSRYSPNHIQVKPLVKALVLLAILDGIVFQLMLYNKLERSSDGVDFQIPEIQVIQKQIYDMIVK